MEPAIIKRQKLEDQADDADANSEKKQKTKRVVEDLERDLIDPNYVGAGFSDDEVIGDGSDGGGY